MQNKLYEQELKKLERKGFSLDTHKWCSYCKKFHKKEAFYKNKSKEDGLQNECKVVSTMRMYQNQGYETTFEETLNNNFKGKKLMYLRL